MCFLQEYQHLNYIVDNSLDDPTRNTSHLHICHLGLDRILLDILNTLLHYHRHPTIGVTILQLLLLIHRQSGCEDDDSNQVWSYRCYSLQHQSHIVYTSPSLHHYLSIVEQT